jgi:hypothetical protein
MWRRRSSLTAIAALIACASACGPTIHFEGGVYADGVVRYRVGPLAPGFERVRVADNDLAWNDPQLGTIAVNSTCTDYEDVPEVALLNQLLFGMTDRVFRIDEVVTLDGRGAHHVIVDVQLDGVPMTLEIYLMRKDGCVYDLSYIAGRAMFERGRPFFEPFVRQFAVLSTNLPAR